MQRQASPALLQMKLTDITAEILEAERARLVALASEGKGRAVTSTAMAIVRLIGTVWKWCAKGDKNSFGKLASPTVYMRLKHKNIKEHQPVLLQKDFPAWFQAINKLRPLKREMALFQLLTGIRREALTSIRTAPYVPDGPQDLPAPKLQQYRVRQEGESLVPDPAGDLLRVTSKGSSFYLPMTAPLNACWARAVAAGEQDVEENYDNWLWPSRREGAGHLAKLSRDKSIGLLFVNHALRRAWTNAAHACGVGLENRGRLLNNVGSAFRVTAQYTADLAAMATLRDAAEKTARFIVETLTQDEAERRILLGEDRGPLVAQQGTAVASLMDAMRARDATGDASEVFVADETKLVTTGN